MTDFHNIFRNPSDASHPESKPSSVIDTLKELTAQRERLLKAAKQEALANAEAAILQLNELGFSYFLGKPEESKPRRARAEGAKSARHKPKDAPCPICNFRTDPPHDRRSHRTQKEKRPFTAEELKALAMAHIL